MLQEQMKPDRDGQNSAVTQVIIAALNEEEGIGLTIAEMLDTLDSAEVIVVDGNSNDRTCEIARNLGATVACQDGKGKGDAIAKALTMLGMETEYVVLTDADYTYPALRVPEMIEILEEKPEIGMVCGNRMTDGVDPKALHRVFHFGNKLIAYVHKHANDIDLEDPLTGLRVVRADLLREWKVKSKGFDIEVELNHYVKQKGFEITEVPIEYRERLGEKKLGIKNGFEIFKRMFFI
jgi:dolichol-phosphate hexosyltransferase